MVMTFHLTKIRNMTGIIIGRFQVPFLHPGHLHLIATSLRECDQTIILLGSRNDIDERNPYGVHYRAQMIRKIFPHIEIYPLWDMDENDQGWSEQVDNFISVSNYVNPILYYSRDSFKEHYVGRLPLKEVEEVPGYSGTKLRQ